MDKPAGSDIAGAGLDIASGQGRDRTDPKDEQTKRTSRPRGQAEDQEDKQTKKTSRPRRQADQEDKQTKRTSRPRRQADQEDKQTKGRRKGDHTTCAGAQTEQGPVPEQGLETGHRTIGRNNRKWK
jgi:hypothetical protein